MLSQVASLIKTMTAFGNISIYIMLTNFANYVKMVRINARIILVPSGKWQIDSPSRGYACSHTQNDSQID